MKNWLYEKSSVIFWFTLVVYIIIWATVSYIGVYVTYVAAPMLVISGIAMWLTAPKENEEK